MTIQLFTIDQAAAALARGDWTPGKKAIINAARRAGIEKRSVRAWLFTADEIDQLRGQVQGPGNPAFATQGKARP